jgi:dTDP-4-amino-4,6-dideoxygalactose transaminase
MAHTDDVAARLIRLPLHPQLRHEQQDIVIGELRRVLG